MTRVSVVLLGVVLGAASGCLDTTSLLNNDHDLAGVTDDLPLVNDDGTTPGDGDVTPIDGLGPPPDDGATPPPADGTLPPSDGTVKPPDLTADLTMRNDGTLPPDQRGTDLACSSTNPMMESCFNNLDDDCNGLTDCADTAACSTATCRPAPGGLFVPAVVVPFGTGCPIGFAFSKNVHRNLMVPSTCTGCSCMPGINYNCCQALATVTDCSNSIGGGGGLSICTSCPTMPIPSNGVTLYKLTGNPALDSLMPGTCPPKGTPFAPQPTWGEDATICTASLGGGCGTGSACFPTFIAGTVCVTNTGPDPDCPTAYPNKTVYYESYQASLGCASTFCSCGGPSGGCGGTSQLGFSDAMCNTVTGSQCTVLLTSYPRLTYVNGSTAPSCSSNPVAVTGGAVAHNAHSICCQ